MLQTSSSWTPLKKGEFYVLNQPELMCFGQHLAYALNFLHSCLALLHWSIPVGAQATACLSSCGANGCFNINRFNIAFNCSHHTVADEIDKSECWWGAQQVQNEIKNKLECPVRATDQMVL